MTKATKVPDGYKAEYSVLLEDVHHRIRVYSGWRAKRIAAAAVKNGRPAVAQRRLSTLWESFE